MSNIFEKSSHILRVRASSDVVMVLVLFFATSSNAGTIWESQDTMYNLNVIGFFHLDIADFKIDPSEDAGLPIDEGFQEARAIAHFSSRLGQRFTAFLEAELAVSESKTELEIERVIVKYGIDNNSQVSFGRFHAPVGFWNQFYHHGRWLQISKDRPLQTEFGGTYLPGHYWGGMYERRFFMSSRTVKLDIGFGAGRDADIKVPGFPQPIESDRAFVAQINIVPVKKQGLSFGGSVWLGDLKAQGLVDVDERVLTGHINYLASSNQFLAEVSTVQHDYADARGTKTNNASYVQYSRRLTALQGKLQPYFRVDYLDLDAGDFVYSGLRSSDRGTIGLRYDVSDNGAIKLEVRHDRFRDSHQSINSYQAQYATYFN